MCVFEILSVCRQAGGMREQAPKRHSLRTSLVADEFRDHAPHRFLEAQLARFNQPHAERRGDKHFGERRQVVDGLVGDRNAVVVERVCAGIGLENGFSALASEKRSPGKRPLRDRFMKDLLNRINNRSRVLQRLTLYC